jgi:hypothetical protein
LLTSKPGWFAEQVEPDCTAMSAYCINLANRAGITEKDSR